MEWNGMELYGIIISQGIGIRHDQRKGTLHGMKSRITLHPHAMSLLPQFNTPTIISIYISTPFFFFPIFILSCYHPNNLIYTHPLATPIYNYHNCLKHSNNHHQTQHTLSLLLLHYQTTNTTCHYGQLQQCQKQQQKEERSRWHCEVQIRG